MLWIPQEQKTRSGAVFSPFWPLTSQTLSSPDFDFAPLLRQAVPREAEAGDDHPTRKTQTPRTPSTISMASTSQIPQLFAHPLLLSAHAKRRDKRNAAQVRGQLPRPATIRANVSNEHAVPSTLDASMLPSAHGALRASPSEAQKAVKLASAAKYRKKNKNKLREADALRRPKKTNAEDVPRRQINSSKRRTEPVQPRQLETSDEESDEESSAISAASSSALTRPHGLRHPSSMTAAPATCLPTVSSVLCLSASPVSMVRCERLGRPGHVYCIPEYIPHPNHTHLILEHGDSVDRFFFAVLTGSRPAIYSDFSQLLPILRTDPDVQYISRKIWVAILAKWRGFCEENHEHEWREESSSRSQSPVYPASLSAFDSSPCPSITDSHRSSLDGPHPDLPPLTTSRPCTPTPSRPPKAPLRSPPSSPPSARPPPLTTKKRQASPTKRRDDSSAAGSATRTSARVPIPATAFSPVRGSTELQFPTPRWADPQPTPPAAVLAHHRRCTNPLARPVYYAVSMCNRLLVSRHRAYKLFGETEEAVMLLASSAGEAAAFFEHESGMQGAPHTMFSVSGERKAFRDRFLQKTGVQMLFSNSPGAIESFIREHVSL
ncbi:hypothetical protein B0H17DRAFT_1201661 [Mycena rosella]|uniref:Uncharacterized protein n=1 Tax=Mycena rosella TaxID=1033263 RepID=A0AAD7DFL3_MYCRO|nr:hypothetical protein B0H17DRAFT_1201661 [Mycena rosella]